jgi:hypothetical protein
LTTQGSDRFPADTSLQLGAARVHEALGDLPLAVAQYKRVLAMDPSNVEAVACIAAHHFYSDQPELALRFYRRLLQMGVNNTEIWTNLGLCCFYASQYDMTLSCFEKALALASDDAMADVWYNIGQVAIGIGDLGLAYQSFKIAVSVRCEGVKGVKREARTCWAGGRGFGVCAHRWEKGGRVKVGLGESHYGEWPAHPTPPLTTSTTIAATTTTLFTAHMRAATRASPKHPPCLSRPCRTATLRQRDAASHGTAHL